MVSNTNDRYFVLLDGAGRPLAPESDMNSSAPPTPSVLSEQGELLDWNGFKSSSSLTKDLTNATEEEERLRKAKRKEKEEKRHKEKKEKEEMRDKTKKEKEETRDKERRQIRRQEHSSLHRHRHDEVPPLQEQRPTRPGDDERRKHADHERNEIKEKTSRKDLTNHRDPLDSSRQEQRRGRCCSADNKHQKETDHEGKEIVIPIKAKKAKKKKEPKRRSSSSRPRRHKKHSEPKNLEEGEGENNMPRQGAHTDDMEASEAKALIAVTTAQQPSSGTPTMAVLHDSLERLLARREHQSWPAPETNMSGHSGVWSVSRNPGDASATSDFTFATITKAKSRIESTNTNTTKHGMSSPVKQSPVFPQRNGNGLQHSHSTSASEFMAINRQNIDKGYIPEPTWVRKMPVNPLEYRTASDPLPRRNNVVGEEEPWTDFDSLVKVEPRKKPISELDKWQLFDEYDLQEELEAKHREKAILDTNEWEMVERGIVWDPPKTYNVVKKDDHMEKWEAFKDEAQPPTTSDTDVDFDVWLLNRNETRAHSTTQNVSHVDQSQHNVKRVRVSSSEAVFDAFVENSYPTSFPHELVPEVDTPSEIQATAVVSGAKPSRFMPVVYAETDPWSIKQLLKERSVRKILIVAILLVAATTAAVLIGVLTTSGHKSGGESALSTSHPSSSPTMQPTFIAEDLLFALVPYSGVDALLDPGSPQFKAITWLSTFDKSNLDVYNVRFVQRYVMAVLYFATNGANWTQSHNWLDPEMHECEWGIAIACEPDRFSQMLINSIDLSRHGLVGSIPHELALVHQLEYLSLAKNSLTGTIPPSVFNLTSLSVLDMNSNKISGEIPATISKAPLLTYLDLSQNSISGTIPTTLYDLVGLRFLDVSFNFIGGSLVTDLGRLQLLNTFNVRSNQIEGPIPGAFVKNQNLAFINLDDNMISGSLPGFSSSFMRRKEITLSHNLLSGPIPHLPADSGVSVFGDLSPNAFRLQRIDVSYNFFTGSIPAFLALIPTLNYLDCSSNYFNGTFPTGSGSGMWRSMEFIAAGLNQLTGSLPTAFPSTLTHYDFHGNRLSGGFPSELFIFPEMEFMSVNKNTLGGSLPSGIVRLPKLATFDVRDCFLEGTLPDLSNLLNIALLDLGENQLMGTMPAFLSELTLLTELRMDVNFFGGTIPSELGDLENLRVVALNDNNLVGTIPRALSKLTKLEELIIAGNQLEGSVPSGACSVIKSMPIEDIGCDLECSCCTNRTEYCGSFQ